MALELVAAVANLLDRDGFPIKSLSTAPLAYPNSTGGLDAIIAGTVARFSVEFVHLTRAYYLMPSAYVTLKEYVNLAILHYDRSKQLLLSISRTMHGRILLTFYLTVSEDISIFQSLLLWGLKYGKLDTQLTIYVNISFTYVIDRCLWGCWPTQRVSPSSLL